MWFFFNPRVQHPSLWFVLSSLFSQVLFFYKDKNKNIKKFILLFLQVTLTLEYLMLYFFIYTLPGSFILYISGIVLLSCRESDSIIFLIGSLAIITYFIATLLSFYLCMQFKTLRDCIINVLGEDVFNEYVGSNPAIRMLSNGTIRIGVMSAAAIIVNGTNSVINSAEKYNDTWIYTKTCKDSGLPVDPNILGQIAVRKSTSLLDRLVNTINNSNNNSSNNYAPDMEFIENSIDLLSNNSVNIIFEMLKELLDKFF